ncbi:erythromycin esterase family protein [Spirosoma flavus]
MHSKLLASLLLAAYSTSFCVAQSSPEIDWLNKQLKPIESVNPNHSSEDLNPFRQMVKQAKLIGLGECTHGSHEIFQMKHRLLTHLVEQLDFTVFAIEADFAGAQLVNEYVQSGKGDSLAVLDALGYWTWYTDEVWQLIKWMKNYNQVHYNKLAFTGFDMNIPYPAIKALRQYAVQRSEVALQGWVDELDTLYRSQALKQTNWEKKAQQLSEEIQQALGSQMASPVMQHCARTLVQYAQMRRKGFHAGNMFRDKCMATNIEWIRQQNPTAKVVLWAHNGHIEKRTGLSKSMGHHLTKTYGSDYLSVGFTTGKGTFTAVRIDPQTKQRHLSRTNSLVEPIADSFEKWFAGTGVANFYLDLRALPTDKAEAGWLTQKKWMRNIGSTVPAKPDYQFTPNHRLRELHDVLIHLNQTTASHSYLVK